MLPVLYPSSETEYKNQGLGTLTDATSCKVTEERNGQYELEMNYPVGGLHYDDIQTSRLIYSKHSPDEKRQAFRIYAISRPIGGIVTVNAEHISYQLNAIPVKPFSASNAKEAMADLKTNAVESCPFSFSTDLTTEANYTQSLPASIRERLGGVEGSILDVYGGEYEWDMYNVKLWKARGKDRGVTLRYGKNITDIKQTESIESTITGIVPYWKGTDDNQNDVLVTVDGYVVESATADNYPYRRTAVVDFTSYFQSQPTKSELQAKAEEYIKYIGLSTVNNEISIYDVDDTIHLCDTVTVEYPSLGISAKAKVIKTVFDVLADRYESVEVGDVKSSMSQTVYDLDKAVNAATNNLTEVVGNFTSLRADYADFKSVTTDNIKANTANIGDLSADLITTKDLVAKKASIDDLNATNAAIKNLGATYATIDLANVKAGSITSAMIGKGVVGTAQIADGSITDAKIVGLTADKITAGTLDATKIDVVNLKAANITVGTINGKQISEGAIEEINLAKYAVTGDKIATDAVLTRHLHSNSVTSDKIVAGAVTAEKIAAKSITANSGIIADLAITNAMIADVSADKINAGTIDAARIGAGSIDVSKLNADSILIGGRNLLKGTGTAWTSTFQTDTYSIQNFKTTTELVGQIYILSFYAKSTVDGDVIYTYFGHNSVKKKVTSSQGIHYDSSTDGGCAHTLTTELKRYWVIYEALGQLNDIVNITCATLLAGKGTGTVTIERVKLEAGTLPSAWTLAPEEISVENIYKANTTLIDGGKIYTGSITSDAIAANAITGKTISGGTISGTTITGAVINGSEFHGYKTGTTTSYLDITGSKTELKYSQKTYGETSTNYVVADPTTQVPLYISNNESGTGNALIFDYTGICVKNSENTIAQELIDQPPNTSTNFWIGSSMITGTTAGGTAFSLSIYDDENNAATSTMMVGSITTSRIDGIGDCIDNGLETDNDFKITATTGSVYQQHFRHIGNICFLTVYLHNDSAVAPGSNFFVGTINNYIPAYYTTSAGYDGTSSFIAQIQSDGKLIVRVIGDKTSKSNCYVWISFVYITDAEGYYY